MALRRHRVLWSILGAFFALSLLGCLLRNPIASFVAGKVLASRGFDCAGVSVHVPIGFPPSPVRLDPMICAVKSGPLQTVAFEKPLEVHLPHWELEKVTCDDLVIDMRPRAHREVERNVVGDLTKLIGADEPATELMFDSAKLSEDDNPPVLAARARITRAKKPVVEFHDLRVTSTEEGMIVSSPRAHVDQAALLGDGILRLVATPTAATVQVQFAKVMKVKLVLDHVDATKPKMTLDIALESTPPPQQTAISQANATAAKK